MLGVTLPDFINPDNARNIALAVGVGSLVLIFLVLRFVQKMMLKLTLSALLALVVFGAWMERADLGDCAKTCECNVLGFDIEVPNTRDCPPEA